VKRVVDVVEKIMCALEEKKAMLRTITRARGRAKNTNSAYRWLNQQFFLPNPGRKSCTTDPAGAQSVTTAATTKINGAIQVHEE
jgi:hypothetical protein